MLPADPAARHREVAARFTALVEGAEAAGAGEAPTPVAGWTAYDVVDHLVTWLPGLLASTAPEAHESFKRPVSSADTPAPGASDRSFERIRAAWQGQAEAVQALLEDPRWAEVQVESPHFPAMSVTQMVDRLYTTDVFLHAWDLAVATGQDATLDPGHCEELYAGMLPLDEVLRASGQYGERVPVPEDAPAQDRLLGFIGRDPAWRPGR